MTTESIFKSLARVDENPNMLTFQLRPTKVAYANTLRRMVLIGVESVAFRSDMNEKGQTTDVVVYENTTPMTNEMLADRIGLIPIHVKDPMTWNPDNYVFELKVENTTEDTLPVKASDIVVKRRDVVVGAEGETVESFIEVPNKEFFHPDPVTGDTCLIAVLKGTLPNTAGQKIHLKAKATVGTGRDHIRFSPVCQCSYGYTIDTDEAKLQSQFEKWIRDSKNKKPEDLKENAKLKDVLAAEFKTMEVQRCYVVDPATGEPNSFDFQVETIGVQPITQIIETALKNIEAKCAKYASIDKDLPENLTVQNADARMKGFDFIFQHEDHTLGNLLQSYMDENMMGKDVTFVGYKVPHPLRDEMVVRVGMDFTGEEKDASELMARVAVAKAAKECAEMFRSWRESWMRESSKGFGARNLASLAFTAENARQAEQASALAAQAAKAPVTAKTAPKTAAKRVVTKQ